jgi:predicted transcriptional regulator
MNLEARKYQFIQELVKVDDERVLEKLELVLKANQSDWFDALSESEKAEIQIGLDQAEKGEFTSHEDVMKRFSKWH